MTVDLDQLAIGVAMGEADGQLLGQSLAKRRLPCAWRTVQQNYTIPRDNERVYPFIRKEEGSLSITEQLKKKV